MTRRTTKTRTKKRKKKRKKRKTTKRNSHGSGRNAALDALRHDIDRLDAKLVRLLNARTRIAVRIGRVKNSNGEETYVPSREREVLARVVSHNRGPLSAKALKAIYREVMSAALAVECDLLIGVHGRAGEPAALAAREHFGGSVAYRFYPSAASLLRALQSGRVHYAFVPVLELARLAAGGRTRLRLWVCRSIVSDAGLRYVIVSRKPAGLAGRAWSLCAWVGRAPARSALPPRWRATPVTRRGSRKIWLVEGPGHLADEALVRRLDTLGKSGRLVALGSYAQEGTRR